ncbi:uncharacterized protein LOC114940056 [Nylanderia fulva]|uniref:uncharacterized protein LOC114940056 n=1 Tax=Nylanderia fulva TaxID=613905 RepID=UPI0010FB5951|nr:uncharacterized protein LOC114940056 [Nylanderia fulva]
MKNVMSEERAREIETQLKDGRFNFAIKCLHEVMKVNPDKNFVFSPLSIYEGLFLTNILITGEITNRLITILSLNGISKADLINYCICKKESTIKFVVYPEHLYCTHNIMCWLKYVMNDSEAESVLSHFIYGPINYLNTNKFSELKVNYINKLIGRAVRKGCFYYLVGLSKCKQVNDILLVTCVCCEFQNSLVPQAIVPIRNRLIINYYHKKLSMHVSDIPFQNGDMSLFVFSPASFDGEYSDKWRIKENISSDDLFELTKRLSTSNGIDELRNLLKYSRKSHVENVTDVSVFSPFDMERNLTIKDLLKALDIEELMETTNFYLDFCGNRRDSLSLCFGNIVHRSRVKVTNGMMIVGAITMILTGKESGPHPEVVNVNRNSQFVWLIYDALQEEILSVGSCNSDRTNSKIVPKDDAGPSDSPSMKKPRLVETS